MDKQNRIITLLLGVLTVVVVGAVLKAAQSVVLPLIIAWLLSYMLGPVVRVLSARRIPAGVSVFMVLMLLLGIVYVAALFFYARVSAFASAYGLYAARFNEIFQDIVSRYDLNTEMLATVEWTGKVGKLVGSTAGSLVSFMSSLVLVIIFLIFLLLGKPFSRFKIYKAFSEKGHADKITTIMDSITNQIGSYLVVQFLISFLTGFLVWLALLLLGVDFPVTWGAMAFFLNFIPNIGSIIASVPPILLAFVQYYPSYWHAIVVLSVLLTIQLVIGSILSPKIMGDRLNLSPVVVLLSLVFWGWLWGLTGALLSTPIASAIKIVCENVEPLRPLAVMMSSGQRYKNEFLD